MLSIFCYLLKQRMSQFPWSHLILIKDYARLVGSLSWAHHIVPSFYSSYRCRVTEYPLHSCELVYITNLRYVAGNLGKL